MAAFPATLPKPLIENYGGTQDQAFIRTEMEAGSVRQRQRFSAANHQLNMSWFLTDIEMATFKTFFDTTINRGSDWFTMNLNVGNGFADYDTRFTKPYEYSRIEGHYWRINASAEVRGA